MGNGWSLLVASLADATFSNFGKLLSKSGEFRSKLAF